MSKKLQLHDAIGPFESKSNMDQIHDAYAAAGRLRSEGERIWDAGSSDFDRWTQACNDLREHLNAVPRRKESGDELQDVLSDFINAFCLSEHRIEEMLSRPDYESEIPSSQDWLHVIFRAAIYGIIRTWLPRGRARPATLHVDVSRTSGEPTESMKYIPWQIYPKYKKYK